MVLAHKFQHKLLITLHIRSFGYIAVSFKQMIPDIEAKYEINVLYLVTVFSAVFFSARK